MGYSGPGKYTSWMSLGYGGSPNPTATSEKIPVLVDGVTTYSSQIDAAPTAGWASGYSLTQTFYDSSNAQISTQNVTSGPLVAGVHTQNSTPPTVAPGGASYCTAQIQLTGSPAAANLLNTYMLKVVTAQNANIPDVVNYNYAFVNGTWPWAASNAAVLTQNAAVLTGADGNYDSLVIGGIIELMGGPGGVQCQIPNLTDPATGQSARFRISTPGGQLQTLSQSGSGPYDLGDFQPTQDFVETSLLDGERPFGTRSSNRQMSIPVAIYAPTQQTLDASRDYLLSLINQQDFEIAWTPKSSGLTTIYDCFRALPSTVMYGFNNLREGAVGAPAIGLVTINIPAAPFGKSGIDGLVEVDFTSNLVSGSPAASSVVLDNFSGTIDTADGWILNTQHPVIGADCVFHRNPTPIKSPYPAVVYQRTGLSANIVGCPVLAVWVGQSYDSQWPKDPRFKSNVTVSAVLTDVNGQTVSCKTTVNKIPWNAASSKPTWTQVSLPIPQKNPKFSYNNVTGYKLTITNWTGGGTAGFVRMNAWLGYVSANPLSITQASSPRGIVYNMFGLVGSARAPVSAQVQLPNSDAIVQEFTQSGFFQVPSGVTSLQSECWGAGGAGSSVSTPVSGGGGGGGEYAIEPSLSVTPGQKIPFTVGTGGQAAQLTPTVLTFTTHGVATTWTCPDNVTSAQVEVIAGGAAGAPGGGGGGGAEYAVKNPLTVTPGTAYVMWVGSGGQPNTGTSSQAQASRNGQNSWFGNPGQKSISGSLIGAHGGKSPPAGSASGGAGGTGTATSGSTTAYAGGAGGRSPGGAGGGGGASADNVGPGAAGAASPKLGAGAAGDYLTGGVGGSGPGGAGGTGANVPGAATPGSGPGGGGGGGYTRTVATSGGNTAVNYQGAAGSPGWIRITYYVNGGNPVNGTGTVFGSAATTSAIVTAHGGVSATADSGSGGTGGSGSGNSAHFPGGTAGLANRNGNYLLTPGTGVVSLASATATGAASLTFTSGATLTSAQIQAGVMLTVSVMTSAALVNPVVSDTAGNQYYLASTKALTDNSCLTTFVTQLQYAVSSSQQLLISNASSVNWAGVWGAVAGVRDLEDTAITGNTGSSSTGSVTRTYHDVGAVYYEIVVVGNNGSSTTQASLAGAPAASAFTSALNGTLGINFACRLAQGSSSAVTLSGALGGSMPWALVTLPFLATNQNGQFIPVISNSAFSGTSGTVTNSGPAAISMDSNSGYHVVKLHTAAAATYTVNDSASNSYAQLGVVPCGTQRIYVFGAVVASALTGSWTCTAASATNQAFSVSSYFVPGGTAADPGGTAVNNATGTAVSLTYPSTTNPSTLQFTAVGYPNNGDLVTGSPAWSGGASGTKLGAVANAAMPAEDDFYGLQQNGVNTPVFTATLSSSQAWGAIVVSIVTPDFSGGGGASGGLAGAGLDASLGASGGAPSYTFGGKGANGQSGNGAGKVGAVPGGGGSGASRISGLTSYAGGNGANGMVRVTHQPPLIPFNDFLLHRPGENAPMDLNPLVPIPVGDPPDNREYAVPQTAIGRNAVFKGTYTVMLCNASWDTPGNSRRISVTVNQYEYAGGPAVSVQATRTLTPATDTVNGYLSMGELTLPIKSVSPSNSDCYYTVSIHDTNQNDAFQDIIFLDVQGQTVLVNIAPGSAGDSRYGNYYIDEPDLDHDLGRVLGSSHERDRAISVLDMGLPTGGPLYVAPGDNLLVAYSTKGAPNLVVTYLPRWFSDRVL